MNASQALAAFVRLLLHARAGGQAKVDALLALSQRTLYVPRKFDGSEGFAALVNENGDWALPVFTSLEQLQAAADVFGWRQQDHSVRHDEVGARRAVHYALNEGASYMVVDAIAAHALEASRDELKPLVSTQNRSDAFGPYAGVGRISSSILEATRPSETPGAASKPALAAPRISRPSAEPSFAPPKLPARVTRASFAAPRDDGAPAQRRPTVSFARSSRPPADVEVHLERNAWAPDASFELDRSSVMPSTGTLRPVAALSEPEDFPPLELEGDPPYDADLRYDTDRPRDTDRPPAFPMAPAPDVLGALPGVAPMPHLDELGLDDLGDLQPSAAYAHAPDTEAPPAGAEPASAAPPSGPPPDAVAIHPLSGPADDDLLAALTERLRNFPEVEWATYSLATRGGRSAKPAVGLRVVDSFRANVETITDQLDDTARQRGVELYVLLLDDPELVRSARSLGEVFYPWRRKTRV